MPAFSQFSKDNLATCVEPLQDLFNGVIKHVDCRVTCGYRDRAAQNKAYSEGFSKVKFPFGNHNTNPSKAVDVIPYPVDWDDLERFKHFGFFVLGYAAKGGYPVRWGADWNKDYKIDKGKWIDLPHYEIWMPS